MFFMMQRDETEWKNDLEGIHPEWLGLQRHMAQGKSGAVRHPLYVASEI